MSVCSDGCAVENLELVREPEGAPALCKNAHASATAPNDAAAFTCPNEGERFVCHRATVYACPEHAAAVPVSVCTFGCADEDEALSHPLVDIAIATSLMCAGQPVTSGFHPEPRDSGVAPP
jgi:hypothetical protein